jgi:formyl-CoA transferase
MSETYKPLAGFKVVELGTLIAGRFCTRILAALGYDAVRIAGLRAAGAI